jgi:hypothetical protein
MPALYFPTPSNLPPYLHILYTSPYVHRLLNSQPFIYIYILLSGEQIRFDASDIFSLPREPVRNPLGNVLAISSLGCSVISITCIICRFIFFTYAILAGLHYSCIRTIDFVTPFVVICLSKHHHHHH